MSKRVGVLREEMGTGWARFVLAEDESPDLGAQLIETAMIAWLSRNSLTVKATLPFVTEGNTTAIHVWFE